MLGLERAGLGRAGLGLGCAFFGGTESCSIPSEKELFSSKYTLFYEQAKAKL